MRSVGVDSWAVDYGLVDATGASWRSPVCYRDERTASVLADVFERVPRAEMFARTGIQFLDFNTLFQLHAHCAKACPPARAAAADPRPAALSAHRRGVGEHTNATTTQLGPRARRTGTESCSSGWGCPRGCWPRSCPPGTRLGPLRPAIAAELGLEGARVVAPATHDTGERGGGHAAAARLGLHLVGHLVAGRRGARRPLLTPRSRATNFTNEGGAYGTIRFLKNVMGLWMLERAGRNGRARTRSRPRVAAGRGGAPTGRQR